MLKTVLLAILLIHLTYFNFLSAEETESASNQLIKIHLNSRILSFFENDSLIFSFPIRVGSSILPTPSGKAIIWIKRERPVFRYLTGPKKGEFLPWADCANGLKRIDYSKMRALGLEYKGGEKRYSIHSVTCSETIGLATSNGCIGLSIPDMLQLFPLVQKGIEVIITDDKTLD